MGKDTQKQTIKIQYIKCRNVGELTLCVEGGNPAWEDL